MYLKVPPTPLGLKHRKAIARVMREKLTKDEKDRIAMHRKVAKSLPRKRRVRSLDGQKYFDFEPVSGRREVEGQGSVLRMWRTIKQREQHVVSNELKPW